MNPGSALNSSAMLGRVLIAIGIVLVIAGALLIFGKPLRLGALPGDITLSGRNWQVSLLIGTSLLLSIILTIALNLIFRRR